MGGRRLSPASVVAKLRGEEGAVGGRDADWGGARRFGSVFG